MTHWGWNNTDDEEEYSSDTDLLLSDCEVIEISSSESEEEQLKEEHAVLEKEEVPVQKQSLPSVGIQSQTLQRTYSNLSGLRWPPATKSGVEVRRCDDKRHLPSN